METTYRPKALTAEQLQALSQDLKQALTELYGDRLNRLVLYGSYARGDFHAESDVDYMVVLNDDEVKAGKEIRQMSPIAGTLSLKYDIEVSVFPTEVSKFVSGYTLFHQAVQQEGICA